jgi:hypothetical protein
MPAMPPLAEYSTRLAREEGGRSGGLAIVAAARRDQRYEQQDGRDRDETSHRGAVITHMERA